MTNTRAMRIYLSMVLLGGCLGLASFILESPFPGTLPCCAVITAFTVILAEIKSRRILRVYCVSSSALVFAVVAFCIYIHWYRDQHSAPSMGTSLLDGLQYGVIVLFGLSHFVFASLFFLSRPPGGQKTPSQAASHQDGSGDY